MQALFTTICQIDQYDTVGFYVDAHGLCNLIEIGAIFTLKVQYTFHDHHRQDFVLTFDTKYFGK